MTGPGHEYAFNTPLHHVRYAAISRHAGPNVGQARTRRDVNRTAKQPRPDHPADPMGRRQSWPAAITQLTPLIPLRRMVQVRVLSEA